MDEKPNTDYPVRCVKNEARLRTDRSFGYVANAVLVSYTEPVSGETFTEMVSGHGTTLKQARAEATAYANSRANFKVW